MEFSVKNRDGPARTGELLIDNKKVTTPNILFVNTSRFVAPDFADILITNNTKAAKPTIEIGKSAFSSLTEDKVRKSSVNDYLIYPKDLSKELHLNSIKYNKKEKVDCLIIPANKEIINDSLKNNDVKLFVVANSDQLFSQQSKFVEFITELRDKIGYQKMIYLPYIGNPSSFSLLAYMGCDFFDSLSAIIAARSDILLFPTGQYIKNDLSEIPCSCPSCSKIDGNASEMNFKQILNHNYFAILNEIKQVRNAISSGNLRELVETRVSTSPILSGMLRILDLNYYQFLEEKVPLIRKTQLLATTKHSLSRPEIRRFQERVLKECRKPSSTKILLLLPCSAKKPYSFSKSHKLFRERIFSLENPYVVHEVIITSPLGVVPRELELTYPASSYDIAVTGHWDEDEKKMIRALLNNHLEINKYDKIIMHLPQAIQDFTLDLIEDSLNTCVDKSTSKESLDALTNVLKKTTSQYDLVESRERAYENIKSLVSYQFGRQISEKLLEGCKIKGKYPYQKIMYNSIQIGMVTKERGLVSLTMNGADRLADSGRYWVEIYDDFTLKGSVFAPGVKDADESIRIGDDVVVMKNNKICGVGVAIMNGKEMKESQYGEAIKIRHRN